MKKTTFTLEEYKVGDSDERPWGRYVVTKVGYNDNKEEVCEKEITVNPGQVLSLQSHDHRRELWRVEEGELTVLLDSDIKTLNQGESIEVPIRSLHCMANLSDKPVRVYEVQEGLCREEDITRYLDAYGRGTTTSDDPKVLRSIESYKTLLAKIKKDI